MYSEPFSQDCYYPSDDSYADSSAASLSRPFWNDLAAVEFTNDNCELYVQARARAHPVHPDSVFRRKPTPSAKSSAKRHTTGLDVPMGAGFSTERYIRGECDNVCIAPWQVMSNLGLPGAGYFEPPSEGSMMPASPRVRLDHSSAFTDATPPPSPSPSISTPALGHCSGSDESDASPITPPDANAERQFPTRYSRSGSRQTSSIDPPAVESSEDEHDDDDDDEFIPQASTHKIHRSSARKAVIVKKPYVRPSTPPQAAFTPLPSTDADGDSPMDLSNHPSLPDAPNSRGRWTCPYEGCTHDTGALGDLIRHLESLAHQPEKKYHCGTCGCTFTRVDALKRHQMKRPERCRQLARVARKL